MNKKQCITLISAMAICFSVHTKEVTLRAVSAFNLGTTFATGLEEFAKHVNANGKSLISATLKDN